MHKLELHSRNDKHQRRVRPQQRVHDVPGFWIWGLLQHLRILWKWDTVLRRRKLLVFAPRCRRTSFRAKTFSEVGSASFVSVGEVVSPLDIGSSCGSRSPVSE